MKTKYINLFNSKEDGLNIYLILNNDGSINSRNVIKQGTSVKQAKRNKQWYLNNKERASKRNKQWHQDNPDYKKQWQKDNPDKVRITKQKYHAKRKGWGYEPINEYFKDAHFHHMHIEDDHAIGIFIPPELHISISHRYNNKESMDKINKATLKWFFSH